MVSAVVVSHLAVVSLGDLVSMGGALSTLFQYLLRPSPPVLLEELAFSRRTLNSPTSCFLVAVST